MRLKDILKTAARFTNSNWFGEAANDDSPVISRKTLGYVATGTTDRKDITINLASHWQRVETLVNEALIRQPDDASADALASLTALRDALKNIATRINETSVFEQQIGIDQQDIDQLLSNLPYMSMVANHYNRVIREGTTYTGVELDEENDQIQVHTIENGVAQFARKHLYEVQMFKFRASSHLTSFATEGLKLDEQIPGF